MFRLLLVTVMAFLAQEPSPDWPQCRGGNGSGVYSGGRFRRLFHQGNPLRGR
jgi:hypothetical protein